MDFKPKQFVYALAHRALVPLAATSGTLAMLAGRVVDACRAHQCQASAGASSGVPPVGLAVPLFATCVVMMFIAAYHEEVVLDHPGDCRSCVRLRHRVDGQPLRYRWALWVAHIPGTTAAGYIAMTLFVIAYVTHHLPTVLVIGALAAVLAACALVSRARIVHRACIDLCARCVAAPAIGQPSEVTRFRAM